MKLSRAVILFAVIAFAPSVLQAQDETGAKLLRQCEIVNESNPTAEQSTDMAYCLGYLGGMIATLDVWRAMSEHVQQSTPLPACVPDVTNRELAMVVVKYLKDNPTKLHEPYTSVAILALHFAYPCKK